MKYGKYPIAKIKNGDIWQWSAGHPMLVVSMERGTDRAWCVTFYDMLHRKTEIHVYNNSAVYIGFDTTCLRDGEYLNLDQFRPLPSGT